jgi:4-alpha-glucanotransferase
MMLLRTRRAGFAVPLFSVRTATNWGIGEIPDLIPLATWAARMGQSIVQLLPINETSPEEASPYAALSAFALDPIYIGMHGIAELDPRRCSRPASVPQGIPADGVLPRAAVRDAKLRLLAEAWQSFRHRHLAGPSERGRHFSHFMEEQRIWLHDYALFRSLKERYAWRCWEQWPAALRNREPAAMQRVVEELAERVAFFCFVQWLGFEQWGEVRAKVNGMGVSLKGDLPFVIGYDSSDGWSHPELFVAGWEIGAPPDDFSASGQRWGLPLYDWPCAMQSDFSWWRARVKWAAQLYDFFRIDHIVGVFRTYGIPTSSDQPPRFHPEAETDQIAQGEAFLRMILAESRNATPIAEDLGIIPLFVRQALGRHGIRGYAVMRWERDHGVFIDPRRYPDLSVATTGTHDTSTLAEWWGAVGDVDRRAFAAALHLDVPASEISAAPLGTGLRRAILARLFEAGSDLVMVPVQDLFGWSERINLPMTVGARNWNYRLPFELSSQGAVPQGVEDESAVIRELVVRSGRHVPAIPPGDV